MRRQGRWPVLLICVWVELNCFVTVHAAAPTRFIDVHVGALNPEFTEILERKFLSGVGESLPASAPETAVRIIRRSSAAELIRSLSDPQVRGVFWIGHSELLLSGAAVPKDAVVLNSFLKAGDGRYLPKSIFSAAHSALQFLGLVTCHLPDILLRYGAGIPQGVKLYRSKSLEMARPTEDNALFFLSSLLTGPKDTWKEMVSDLSARSLQPYTPATEDRRGTVKISVTFRDVFSTRFDYEVLLDRKLIGTLSPELTPLGIAKNEATREFEIPISRLEGGALLTIRPDDAQRPSLDGRKVVDDLLLDRITLTSGGITRTFLDRTVHIGDDSRDWDRAIGLTNRANEPAFAEIPPTPEWRQPVGLP